MLWGLTLKPGASCTKVFNEEVHLSLVSMESRKEFGRVWPGSYSQVVMNTEGVELLLCTLVHGSIFQQNLDMKLMPNEKVTFTAYGDCLIYISGYTNHMPRAGGVHEETSQEFDISEYDDTLQEDVKVDPGGIESASWIPDNPDDQNTDPEAVGVDCHLPEQNLMDDGLVPTITIKEEDLRQDSLSEEPSQDLPAFSSAPQAEDLVADVDGLSEEDQELTAVDPSRLRGTQRVTTGIMSAWQTPSFKARHPRRISTKKVRPAGGQDTSHWVDLSCTAAQEMLHPAEDGPSVVHDNSCSGVVPEDGTQYTVVEPRDPQEYLKTKPTSLFLALSGSSLPSDRATINRATTSRATINRPRVDPITLPRGRKQSKSKAVRSKAAAMKGNKKGLKKEHCCSVCKKSFIHISSLVRHERIHTGVKPYPCRICWKPFSDVGNRTKHERIHAKGKTFPCASCRQMFLSAGARSKHQCPVASIGVGIS